MPQVTLNYADGVSRSFHVATGGLILDAAVAAEIPVLYQCQSGSCGTCVARLSEGDALIGAGVSSSLLASEVAAGIRLLCVCEASSDCSFDLDYTSQAGTSVAHEVHAFIDLVEQIASNAVRLKVELADGEWMEFLSGQYMQIEVPECGVVRSYSPSSVGAAVPTLEFLIRILPDGAMSNFLSKPLAPDQMLKLTGPYGSFFLREEKKRAPHIFIAGGTGLAPILSMIDALRTMGGRKPPMLLSFGCATPDALFCLDDIALRKQWLPTLEARICVDRDPQEGMHHGNPVSALRAGDVKPDTVAYLCGPQVMIDAACRRLIELGADPANIYSEQFTPSN